MARIEETGGTSNTPKTKNLPKYLRPIDTTPPAIAKPKELPTWTQTPAVPSWSRQYQDTVNKRRLAETIQSSPSYLPMFRSTGAGYSQFDPAREADIANYRDNILTGRAYGGMYKSQDPYVTEGYDPNGESNRAAWQKALDYQDAGARRAAAQRYGNTIHSFGGLLDTISGAAKRAAGVAQGLASQDVPGYDKVEANRLNRGAPTVGPREYLGGVGGGQGQGGYPGYGGVGGGGGGGSSSNPWWMDMYQWRF